MGGAASVEKIRGATHVAVVGRTAAWGYAGARLQPAGQLTAAAPAALADQRFQPEFLYPVAHLAEAEPDFAGGLLLNPAVFLQGLYNGFALHRLDA